MDRRLRFALRDRRGALIAAIGFYVLVAVFVAWRRTAVDYPVYVIAASGFLRGEDVYAWGRDDFVRAGSQLGIERHESQYLYPPLTALVAAPLLSIPYRLGLFLWSLASGMAVIATGLALGSLMPDDRWRQAVQVATWLFVPFLTGIYAGQVNPFVVFLAAGAVLGLQRGRDWIAGAALAMSLLLKPLAIGLLLYGVWRGRWRFVAAAALAGVTLLVACWFVFGPSALGFVGTISEWAPRSYPPSQNLPGLALRWLGDHPFGEGLVNRSDVAYIVAALVSTAAAAASVLFCWPPGRSRPWSASELSCVLAVILVVHARTWYHHYPMLALSFVLLLSRNDGSAVRWAVLATAYMLVQAFGLGWHWLAGSRLALESATFGALIVWGVALLDVRRARIQTSAPGVIVSGRH